MSVTITDDLLLKSEKRGDIQNLTGHGPGQMHNY